MENNNLSSQNPNIINGYLVLDGKQIEHVNRYKYLEQENEIKISIEMARKAFIKYKSTFKNTTVVWARIMDTEGTISQMVGSL